MGDENGDGSIHLIDHGKECEMGDHWKVLSREMA